MEYITLELSYTYRSLSHSLVTVTNCSDSSRVALCIFFSEWFFFAFVLKPQEVAKNWKHHNARKCLISYFLPSSSLCLFNIRYQWLLFVSFTDCKGPGCFFLKVKILLHIFPNHPIFGYLLPWEIYLTKVTVCIISCKLLLIPFWFAQQ